MSNTLINSLNLMPMANTNRAPRVISPNDVPANAPVIEKADNDYEFARQNMRNLIDLGMDIAAEAAQEARNAPQANSFVAFAQIIKNIADVNKELLSLSKQRNDLDGGGKQEINNNLIVTTADLLKMLKRDGEE